MYSTVVTIGWNRNNHMFVCLFEKSVNDLELNKAEPVLSMCEIFFI